MSRVILHADANSFYASVEVLYHPNLQGKPVAVCGDPEARHGIVLAKTPQAKQCGVKTGMAIWQARQACPELVVMPPHVQRYIHFSNLMREVYSEYTDRVEPFGLDEAWLDLSSTERDIPGGARLADALRRRIREELGITVSIGVSFNKVFAKLGSDMKKPDATTALSQENYRQRAWPLPVSDLLFVGPCTDKKLARQGIHTIGDLAMASVDELRCLLGKNGLMLRAFARGEDLSPVALSGHGQAIKSIGNSTTPPHDITTLEQARCIYSLLAESVAVRLRKHRLRAQVISISARTVELTTFSCQKKISPATSLTDEITAAARTLFESRFLPLLPLRSAGLCCSSLVPDDTPIQLDFFGNAQQRLHREALERSIDALRSRYGHQIIRRGISMADAQYAAINPVEDHIIHPMPFYGGSS